jgi:hypothetical protein
MRRILLVVLFLILLTGAYAQKAPFWLDPYQRESKYPNDQFLVGLSSELVGKNQSLASIYKQLNQMSRNQIIESIHVNVKSETEMNISIVNTQSTQLLDQNSVSISKAELVGLKFENYYDKKKKTAFTFSYVSIQDLIDYNLDIIQNNTNTIDNNVALVNTSISGGDKERAIDLLFESQQKLQEINQAAVILMALGQDDRIDFDKIGQMKLEVAQGTDDFFNKGSLNVELLASFYAYALQLQIGDAGISICRGNIGYQNSTRESKFSTEFNNRVLNKLADHESVSIGETGCDVTFEGTFSLANNVIVLVTNFADPNGKIQVAVNKKFPFTVMSFGDLTFLPENFEYITDLSSIQINPEQMAYEIRKVELFRHPIIVGVKLKSETLIDIPLRFSISKDEANVFETSISTSKKGIAEFVLNEDQFSGSGDYIVDVRINVAQLLDVDSTSDFINTLLIEYPPQSRQIKLRVIAPTIYVNSIESSLGQPLGINILAPSVKNSLIVLDYKFVETPGGADYIINIESSTREGQANQYAYFAYLDATVSMIRTDTGKEIYKNSLTSVKGAGANFDLASAKAYEKAKTTIGSDLSYQLEFGDFGK